MGCDGGRGRAAGERSAADKGEVGGELTGSRGEIKNKLRGKSRKEGGRGEGGGLTPAVIFWDAGREKWAAKTISASV